MVKSSVINIKAGENAVKPDFILPSDMNEISSLDCFSFGAERTYLLGSLHKENPDKAFCIRHNDGITSFLMGRKGRKYFQVGPVVATEISEAKELILLVLQELFGEEFVVDVPYDKAELITWLEGIGFVRQRQFIRMFLHLNSYPGHVKNNYLISGPEYG
jgi:hypothetical protein